MARSLQPRVFLVGRVALESDGRVIDESQFPGRQGRLTFAYLVAEQGRAVPRDELAEALWGEAPPSSWDKALTGIVSKLRGLLADQGIDGANRSDGRVRLLPARAAGRQPGSTSWRLRPRRTRPRLRSRPASSTGRRMRQRLPRRCYGSSSSLARKGRGSSRSGASSPTSAAVHSVRWPRRPCGRATRRRR